MGRRVNLRCGNFLSLQSQTYTPRAKPVGLLLCAHEAPEPGQAARAYLLAVYAAEQVRLAAYAWSTLQFLFHGPLPVVDSLSGNRYTTLKSGQTKENGRACVYKSGALLWWVLRPTDDIVEMSFAIELHTALEFPYHFRFALRFFNRLFGHV